MSAAIEALGVVLDEVFVEVLEVFVGVLEVFVKVLEVLDVLEVLALWSLNKSSSSTAFVAAWARFNKLS